MLSLVRIHVTMRMPQEGSWIAWLNVEGYSSCRSITTEAARPSSEDECMKDTDMTSASHDCRYLAVTPFRNRTTTPVTKLPCDHSPYSTAQEVEHDDLGVARSCGCAACEALALLATTSPDAAGAKTRRRARIQSQSILKNHPLTPPAIGLIDRTARADIQT